MERKTIVRVFIAFFIFVLINPASILKAQIVDADALMMDIPEPPGARSELPSPVPMVYEFMGGVMDGQYDKCLANFDTQTFLSILFKRQLKRMNPVEYRELYAFQVQSHRNEFRFLAGVMNRVAKGAKINYSDPRYHKKVQSKIVIKLNTNRGRFNFIVYCRYRNERWFVYDYILNGQRLSHIFAAALRNVKVDTYVSRLRPFYDERKGYRPIRSKEFDFSVSVPNRYEIKQNVSSALLATVSAFDGQFLMHIQAAKYGQPQTLAQAAAAIKQGIVPFKPRLYDQWKSELAGVEIGNVLFHFLKNGKRLFTHMVIIPLGKKLIVINFYHSSLQLLKHMTNIREKILETLSLPKVEAAGGVEEGEFPDELSLPSNDNELEIDSGLDSGDLEISTETPVDDLSLGDGSDSEIPPPSDSEADDMLTPDSYTSGGGSEEYPEPPPPPPLEDDMGDELIMDDDDAIIEDDEIPPPPPPPGSYGDGAGTDSGEGDYLDPGEGSEVSF